MSTFMKAAQFPLKATVGHKPDGGVITGVAVLIGVGVRVAVAVGVRVGVAVGVLVRVAVGVAVGVRV